tara:strand:- start:156 stop:299 length:144 start_codon:yes stop_codon:yes gene_type:complete
LTVFIISALGYALAAALERLLSQYMLETSGFTAAAAKIGRDASALLG